MSGIMLATIRQRAGVLNTNALSVDAVNSGAAANASAIFQTNGTIKAGGTNPSMSPDPAFWWTSTLPPATWMSYTSTGSGIIVGGLVAGTRYQLNVARTLGITRSPLGIATTTFTISFHDASTGGTLLGTKTYTASAERV